MRMCYARGTRRKDEHAVRNGDRFGNVVRDQERRLFFTAYDIGDVFANVQPRLIVERRERLVKEQNVGIGSKRSDEGGAG